MNTNQTATYTITINRTIVWLIIFGLILLLGVIMLSSHINATLAAEPTTSPVATTIAQTPVVVPAEPKNLNDIQSILNNPANFRVIPKDISPVQAFMEGKTTKFLMGF